MSGASADTGDLEDATVLTDRQVVTCPHSMCQFECESGPAHRARCGALETLPAFDIPTRCVDDADCNPPATA